MSIVNSILVIVGLLVIILGIASFILPTLTRFINAPGNEKIKSIIATFTGIILLLVGLFI